MILNKVDLLENNLLTMAKKLSRAEYLYKQCDFSVYKCDIDFIFDTYFSGNYVVNNITGELEQVYKVCKRILNAWYKKIQRLTKRVNAIINGDNCPYCFYGKPYFLTFTFSDSVLATTTYKARRDRVCDFLRENYSDYVANIDYAPITNREHYHAVVYGNKKVDYTSWYNPSFPSGLNAKLIHVENVSVDKMCEYINKLVNHAIKDSTKRECIIYKRFTKNS